MMGRLTGNPLILFFVIYWAGCHQPVPLKSLEKVSKNVIILNIGTLSRDEIATGIMKLHIFNPNVIGIDVYFKSKGQECQDSLLRSSLRIPNIIVGCKIISQIEGVAQGMLQPDTCLTVPKTKLGHTTLVRSLYDNKITHYSPFFLDENGAHFSTHFSLKIVQHYDQKKYDSYLQYLSSHRIITDTIRYRRNGSGYPTYNLADLDSLDPSIFRDKIVLLGYTGPRDEDKKYTPLGNGRGFNDRPDTYGVYILANIVEQILAVKSTVRESNQGNTYHLH